MNANAIKQLFDYHFTENHKLVDEYVAQLSLMQFTQLFDYSHGSVRDQLVHLMSVDNTWFCGLRGVEIPEPKDPRDYPDLGTLQVDWAYVENEMQEFLKGLADEHLMDKPLTGEDNNLYLWQVLVHVVIHGTDHRAQILRVLHDLGIITTSQDFIFYVYENPS